MAMTRKEEIDRNFDFFQRNLGRYLPGHSGQFALLKDARLIGFFERPGEAYPAGLARFPDGIFSIQEVRQEPIELGHLALGHG